MANAHVIDETPQARRELATGQYGDHPHAEALIRSHFASIPPEVRSAMRLGDNPDALAKAKEADAGADINVPEGCTLIGWTVRGTDPRRMVLSYVYEDASGRWFHGVQGYSDSYEAPAENPNDRTVREVALHDARVQREAGASNAEIEAKLAEFRKELQAQQVEHFKALQDTLVANLKEIAGKDESGESETPSAGSTQSSTRTDSSGQSGKGDPQGQPELSGETVEDDDEEGNDEDGDVTYPRQHAALDDMLTESGKTKPEDWDDWKVDPKIAYLRDGTIPEDEG